MKITFCGQEFILHPSGALLWPDQEMIIVSDLHLEKGSHFAKKGFFLPPYDSQEILTRLHDVIKSSAMKKLLILGDCFHDDEGYARFPKAERALFDSLTIYDPIWIKGNHDGDFVPPHFESYEIYERLGIKFSHEAIPGVSSEISGHFHPKVDVVLNKDRMSYSCFIEDGRKMILPAFGAYTGGLNINNPIYLTILSENAKYYLLGKTRVHLLADPFNS